MRRRFFRAKNYDKAIEAYTLALEEAPGCRRFCGTARAAHEKLQKWSDVEADAAALKADAAAGEPVSAKALLRRAAALVQLSRPEDAITAYRMLWR